jgi:hypothetical protein
MPFLKTKTISYSNSEYWVATNDLFLCPKERLENSGAVVLDICGFGNYSLRERNVHKLKT